MTLSPKESGKYIAELAEHVKVNQEGIKKLGEEIVKEINNGNLSVQNFSQNKFHPNSTDPKAIDWIFVVDALNFCFWTSGEGKQGWNVEGQSGYFALCAAINRAVNENIDITNPHFYSKITSEELAHILRGDTDRNIPLLDERVKSLQQSGKTLIEKFGGTFKTVVDQAQHSAVRLLQLTVQNFPGFRDEAEYRGKQVSLYKRAQILVGDIWACFMNKGAGNFNDIDELTMFADYRVPQSLMYWGVFEYSEQLLDVLNSNTRLVNGSEMEVEIRGCSIHAVELLKGFAKERIQPGKIVNSVLIDHFLWDFRRDNAAKIITMKLPFHKTSCIFY